jgi:hypothetical protein
VVISPSGVREITVPWHKIVTVSLFDVPIFKDRSFGNSIMKDGRDVDVFDLIIVLVWSCSDFDTSDKDVFEFSSVVFPFNGVE